MKRSCCFLCVLFCWISILAPVQAQTGLIPGTALSPLVLPDTEGQAHHLDEWTGRGHPVVLNFWAFWCDTWKAELPHLRLLAEQQEPLGFSLVAISVDGMRLPEFVRQRGAPVSFPVLLDEGSRLSRQYKVSHVPTVVILDAEGRVRYSHVGYPGNDILLRVLRHLDDHPPIPVMFKTPARPARKP